MGDILNRAGLVSRRRRHLKGEDGSSADYSGPNNAWCIDYKGQFRPGDGRLCYPLTLTDGYNSVILCCEGHSGPRQSPSAKGFQGELVFLLKYELPLRHRSAEVVEKLIEPDLTRKDYVSLNRRATYDVQTLGQTSIRSKSYTVRQTAQGAGSGKEGTTRQPQGPDR